MKLPSLLLTVALVLLALFALINWGAITTPTVLSLGFAEVSAPLGLIMLAAAAVLSGLFMVYIAVLQAGAILESRRATKELHQQRELADKAEASRFTELRTQLMAELARIETREQAAASALQARVDALEALLREQVAESTRTVSAYLGEIEDKLDRVLPPGQG
jgi:uncharacterized integral membrane protein